MYRAGAGGLDHQIAQTLAAVRHHSELTAVLGSLAERSQFLRQELGSIEMAEIEQNHRGPARAFVDQLRSLFARRQQALEALIGNAESAIEKTALEHELAVLGKRQRELREEIVKVADASEHLSSLLTQKESWLARTGSPNATEALALADGLGQLKALLALLKSTFECGSKAQEQLYMAVKFFEDAHSWLAISSSEGRSKQGFIENAVAHSVMASVYCRELAATLPAVAQHCEELRLELPPELAPTLRPSVAPSKPVFTGMFSKKRPVGENELSGDALRTEAEWVADLLIAVVALQGETSKREGALAERRRQLLASVDQH